MKLRRLAAPCVAAWRRFSECHDGVSSDRIHCLIARIRLNSASVLAPKAPARYHPDMTFSSRHLLLLIVVGVVATDSVWAKDPEPRDQRQGTAEENRARGQSNLPESVRRVERQTGGEVLRAEPMQRDGREVYRVKVLTSDGRVRVIQDDPQSPERSDRRERTDGAQGGGERRKRRADDNAGDDGNPV